MQSALTLYFFTTGTRTPLLALLALRRPRNLAPIVLAPDQHMRMGMAGIEVIDRDPIESRPKVLLHLAHHAAHERL